MGDGIQRKFALIINGDTEVRHLENVDRAIKALRAEDPSYQIAVASPSKPNESTDQYQPANQPALEKLISGIKPDDDDLFVLYVTGHGDKGTQLDGCAKLSDTCYELGDLGQALSHLEYGRRIVVTDTCKGGGGLIGFANERSTVVTLGSRGQDVFCQEFSPYFWGTQVPDRNSDGIITVGERYAHTVKKGKPRSHPQFYEAQAPISFSGKVGKPPFKPKVVEVNDLKALKGQVKRLDPDQRALVMFSADWCEACKEHAPKFEELAKKYAGQFLMIRAEGKNKTEEEWTKEFGITSLPFVAFIDPQTDPRKDSPGHLTAVANKEDPLTSLPLAAVHSIEGQKDMYKGLLTDSDPYLRVKGMQMLLAHGTPREMIELTPILLKWMQGPNKYVSNFAGNALSIVAALTPLSDLVKSIDDPNREISIFAQISLKMIASKNVRDANKVFEALLPKIGISHGDRANFELKTLAEIMAEAPAGQYKALKWKRVSSLFTFLKDKDPKTCVVALRTLMDEKPSGSPSLSSVIKDVIMWNKNEEGLLIINQLLQALKDSPDYYRPKVIQLFENIGFKGYHAYAQHPKTISQLIDLLNDRNQGVREWSALTLEDINKSHTRPVDTFISNDIIPTVKSDSATKRKEAIVKIVSIAIAFRHNTNLPKLTKFLYPFLKDTDPKVRKTTKEQFERLGIDVDAVKLDMANDSSRGHIGTALLFSAVTEAGAGGGVQINGGYRFPHYWSVVGELAYQNHPQVPTHRISTRIEPRVHFLEQPREFSLGLPSRGDPYISLPSLGFAQDINEKEDDVSYLTVYPAGLGLNWYFSKNFSLHAAIKGRIDIPVEGPGRVHGGVDIPIGGAISF